MGRISYSQLSMFSDCPQRWKLNYIDKLRVSEPSIFLIFGTAMHEVLQKYLEVMYFDKVKTADMLNLERSLQEKMIEQFNIDKEAYGKDPCTKEQLKEFFQDGCNILDFFKKHRGEHFSKNEFGEDRPSPPPLQRKIQISREREHTSFYQVRLLPFFPPVLD